MADTSTVNPLAWNFNTFDYLKPTELRSGYTTPYSFNSSIFNSTGSASSTANTTNQSNTNPFGNWSSLGMSDLFNDVGSLCSYADAFTQQNASIIAQAEAYNNAIFSQNLYQAQQTSASTSQLSSLLGLLGLGGTTGTTTGTASTSQLSSLLGLLGLGGTSSTTQTVDDWWNYTDPYSVSDSTDDSSSSDDAFWEYIDSKATQSQQQNQLQSLLSQLIGA